MLPVIEIRTYQLHPGAAARFHQTMQQQSMALLRAAGTDVLAAGPSLENAESYMLVRAYASRAERISTQAAFYQSDAWRHGPHEAVMACIASYHTLVLEAEPSLIASMRRLKA